MATLSELALYQQRLMDVFTSAETVDDALRALHTDAAFAPFQTQIAQWDPDMIGVALAVTKRWAVQNSGRGEGL
ncbi:MAG: hypothetical protein U0136_07155 [Bdellovibrionota bacterium]